MNRNRQSLPALIFGSLVSSYAAQAQNAPAILQVDIENYVSYVEDSADGTGFATAPSVTPAVTPKNLSQKVVLGDIVAVNGQAAKGTVLFNTRSLNLTTSPSPGNAIADTTRAEVSVIVFELLRGDGSPVGSLMCVGESGGSPPPGSPLAQISGNSVIVGGTGAFFGARGSQGRIGMPTGSRAASITEDPSYRRTFGGSRVQMVLVVIPLSTPQVVTVYHADFSPVAAARPAKPGELLIVKATGLGPAVPGVNPGEPFPFDVLQPVNSPVAVSVNGQSADVINAIGWPGQVDTFRVDFRVPDATASGAAAIQLTAAWIPGAAVSIPVQKGM